MRDDDYVRAEIRWLLERARAALGLPASAVVGCTEEQIAQILEVQGISEMPPPLDELMRVAGMEGPGTTLLGALLGYTCVGYDAMLHAKGNARKTAAYTGSDETFGPDRAVFLSDPGGSVLWVETGKPDPSVWGLSEGSRIPRLQYPRFACFLERDVLEAEAATSRPG